MNFLLANSFTTFFNNLFSDWKLVLFIVLTILLIVTIFFKRFKIAFFVLLATSIAGGAILIGFFIKDAVEWDLYGFIDFLVKWLPTILFSTTIVLSTLINALRGRRKSLIFLLHSVAAAIVWVFFYYFAVQSKAIDAALVKFVNLFMGENGLQSSMGVSAEADTFRNILALYFERLAGEGTLGILAHDTHAYVYTLADMVYHIGFALITYLFYLLTVFILYIIYHCCYSDRKYKKKKTQELGKNNTDEPYKKRYVAGGFVGLARGVVAGVLSLSFLGAGLYMVTGGRGEGTLKDTEMSGQYENQLKIYRSLESYGTHGIFLVLNAMSDPNDLPYYLFAADLVFSGELDDAKNGVSENVSLTEELGALSGFARDTVRLLLEYGSEEINGALDGSSDTGIMQNVLNVMKKEEFRNEFDALIAQFDTPTYVYNFSMSLVSSVLANIDSMSFAESLSPQNRELVKILFKEGYLSSYIPEDCALHDLNERKNAEDPWLATGSSVRPYVGLQKLVSKEDIRSFMNIFLTVLSERGEGVGTFDMIRSITPQLKELSLFDNGKSESVDPVLARVYCYLQNAYLKAEGAEGYSYNAIVKEQVAWTGEISKLLDVAEEIYTVYDDVKDAESAVFNRILYIFDKENPNRNRDIELYDKISEQISSSYLLGKTLATSFFRNTLTEGLGQLFTDLYIPTGIVYENTVKGDAVQYGELHYFLKGLRHLGTEGEPLFELLFGEAEQDISSILSTIDDVMEKSDGDGNNFAYYTARSDLLRSAISCYLINEGADVIYVPDTAREKDERGVSVNVIVGDELEILLNGMGTISDFVTNCVDGDYYASIDGYLGDESENGFMALFNKSRIVEGSLAKLVKENLVDNDEGAGSGIVVPKYYRGESVENWCSPASGGKGELKRFIDSYLDLRAAGGKDENEAYILSLENLMNGDVQDKLLTAVADLGEKEGDGTTSIGTFLSSDIIYYTVSDYIQAAGINSLTIVIPASAQNKLYDDVLDSVIKKDELNYVFSGIKRLGIDDATEATDLLKKLIANEDVIQGDVLSASVVANMVRNSDFRTVLRLDSVFVREGTSETYYTVGDVTYLNEGYYYQNPWCEELPRLLSALRALFEEEIKNEEFRFNADAMADALSAAANNESAMKACRNSRVINGGYGALLPSEGSSEETT